MKTLEEQAEIWKKEMEEWRADMNIGLARLEIRELEKKIRELKKQLRTTWTKPMGLEQGKLQQLKNHATEVCCVLAWYRKKTHYMSPSFSIMIARRALPHYCHWYYEKEIEKSKATLEKLKATPSNWSVEASIAREEKRLNDNIFILSNFPPKKPPKDERTEEEKKEDAEFSANLKAVSWVRSLDI